MKRYLERRYIFPTLLIEIDKLFSSVPMNDSLVVSTIDFDLTTLDKKTLLLLKTIYVKIEWQCQ